MSDVPRATGCFLRQRRRAFKPKSSTGCLTCKIRRIKCDEAKPNCNKCVTTGRKCDGYVQVNQVRGRGKSPRKEPKLELWMDKFMSLDIAGTDQERHCFEFFRSHTIPQLSYFDLNFWNQLILQASHHEPAIRHAAIALGSLHQQFEFEERSVLRSNATTTSDSFALQQYVKAIQLVVQPIREHGKQAADIALVTCVLFVCFETLRGHHGSALSHIGSGVKILGELLADFEGSHNPTETLEISKHPYVPLSALKLVFIRLDSQASQVGSDRQRELLSPVLDDKKRGYQEEIPEYFSSLEESRNSLDYVWTAGIRELQGVHPVEEGGVPLNATFSRIRHVSAVRLQQWSQAFEIFLQNRSHDFGDVEQECIHINKVHRILSGICFSINFLTFEVDESSWDSYYVEFEAVVTHSSAVVKFSSSRRSTGNLRLNFSIDTGIILPLYLVAAKCRHPTIRRKAISLLKSTSRQEGVLNSILTGRVAERLAQIEEERLGEITCAEDIPNWARLSGVDVKFDPERKRAFLRYIKTGSEESKRYAVQEWLEW